MNTELQAIALDEAAQTHQHARVQQLLSTVSGWSHQVLNDALISALEHGSLPIADELMHAGAEPQRLPPYVWVRTIEAKEEATLAWLIRHGDPGHDDHYPLRLAASRQQWHLVRMLLPVSEAGALGSEALHNALAYGADPDLIEALCQRGARLDEIEFKAIRLALLHQHPAAAWLFDQMTDEAWNQILAQWTLETHHDVLDALLLMAPWPHLDAYPDRQQFPQAQARWLAHERQRVLETQHPSSSRSRQRS